jgi:TRAP transporter TAXI family solute receptor
MNTFTSALCWRNFSNVMLGMVSVIMALHVVHAGAAERFIALGSASKSGVYFPVGKGVCELVNERRDEHFTRCLNYVTGGSIYNIQGLQSGQLDVAITRADLVEDAYFGKGHFEGTKPNKDLRIISALYRNPLAIIVKQNSRIKTLSDAAGKRINIGNIGSGQRALSEILFNVMGWTHGHFSEVTELSTSEMGKAFCKGEIDIMIQLMGIPSAFYSEMVDSCNGKFIGLSPHVIQRLRQQSPFLNADIIPAGMFSNNPDALATVGANAVLITTNRTSEDAIYTVSKMIYSQLDAFKQKSAALSTLTQEKMIHNTTLVPLHGGTLRYLKDIGAYDSSQERF